LGQHGTEELPGYLVLQQPSLILGKGRRVKGLIHDVQVQEPLEKEVILEALAELAFTPDGVQGDEQAAFEQMFWRNGGTAHLSVHLVEGRRQFRQGSINNGLNPSDGMILGDQLVWGQGTELQGLLFRLAAHSRLHQVALPRTIP
jgi:hypothetical protein